MEPIELSDTILREVDSGMVFASSMLYAQDQFAYMIAYAKLVNEGLIDKKKKVLTERGKERLSSLDELRKEAVYKAPCKEDCEDRSGEIDVENKEKKSIDYKKFKGFIENVVAGLVVEIVARLLGFK